MNDKAKIRPHNYRINDWPSHNRVPAERGSLGVWFSPEVIDAWSREKYSYRLARGAIQSRSPGCP